MVSRKDVVRFLPVRDMVTALAGSMGKKVWCTDVGEGTGGEVGSTDGNGEEPIAGDLTTEEGVVSDMSNCGVFTGGLRATVATLSFLTLMPPTFRRGLDADWAAEWLIESLPVLWLDRSLSCTLACVLTLRAPFRLLRAGKDEGGLGSADGRGASCSVWLDRLLLRILVCLRK